MWYKVRTPCIMHFFNVSTQTFKCVAFAVDGNTDI
nr:MAG TPA: hypothetical protein [Caudoviricetes sp.]